MDRNTGESHRNGPEYRHASMFMTCVLFLYGYILFLMYPGRTRPKICLSFSNVTSSRRMAAAISVVFILHQVCTLIARWRHINMKPTMDFVPDMNYYLLLHGKMKSAMVLRLSVCVSVYLCIIKNLSEFVRSREFWRYRNNFSVTIRHIGSKEVISF